MLNHSEWWHMEREKLKVLNNIVYLGVTLRSMGGCKKEKVTIQAIGNKTRNGNGKCLTRTPNMKVDMLYEVEFPRDDM